MFSPLLTFPYATHKGEPCIVIGFMEVGGVGTIQAVVALLDGGDMTVADLKDVKIDIEKLRKIPKS